MTKKDYVALASAFVMTKPIFIGDMYSKDYADHSIAYAQWRDDVLAVIDACAANNPAFHRGKFVAACGVPNIGGNERQRPLAMD